MDPASALLLLKTLLAAIDLAKKQVEIFRTRGEYSDAELAEVRNQRQAWLSDPAWQIKPDPGDEGTTTGAKPEK